MSENLALELKLAWILWPAELSWVIAVIIFVPLLAWIG